MKYGKTGFINATDGTRLFYGVAEPERAAPPTLVFCDGLGCDGFAWTHLQPALSEHYRTLHVHFRDHGRSGTSRDRSLLTIADLARDIRVMLDALGEQSVVLLGHSMGTQVALEYYRLDPQRVAGLVLICGSYGNVTETFHGSDLLSQFLPTALSIANTQPGLARAVWARVPPKVAFQVARITGEIDLRLREEDFQLYWEHASLMDPEIFLGLLHSAGEHSAESLLPEIEVPTFVIAGEKDTFTPMPLARHMAEAIPEAVFEVIEGGTHAAPVEQPDLIAARIQMFVEERVRRAAD